LRPEQLDIDAILIGPEPRDGRVRQKHAESARCGDVPPWKSRGDGCDLQPRSALSCCVSRLDLRTCDYSVRPTKGPVHPAGCVAAGMMGCHCNVPTSGDLSPATRPVDRSAVLVGESWTAGVSLRTNPAPRTLRIMVASFDPSTLRRSRPI
jgi:hypothetical protein